MSRKEASGRARQEPTSTSDKPAVDDVARWLCDFSAKATGEAAGIEVASEDIVNNTSTCRSPHPQISSSKDVADPTGAHASANCVQLPTHRIGPDRNAATAIGPIQSIGCATPHSQAPVALSSVQSTRYQYLPQPMDQAQTVFPTHRSGNTLPRQNPRFPEPPSVHQSLRHGQRPNPEMLKSLHCRYRTMMDKLSQIDDCPFCKHVFVNSLELAKHFSDRCPKLMDVFVLDPSQLSKAMNRRVQRDARRSHPYGVKGEVEASPIGNMQPLISYQSFSLQGATEPASAGTCDRPVCQKTIPCSCPCARSNMVTSFCPLTNPAVPSPNDPQSTKSSSPISGASNNHRGKDTSYAVVSPVDSAIRTALSSSVRTGSRSGGKRPPPGPSPLAAQLRNNTTAGLGLLASRLASPVQVYKQIDRHPAINNPLILKQAAAQAQQNHGHQFHPAQVPTLDTSSPSSSLQPADGYRWKGSRVQAGTLSKTSKERHTHAGYACPHPACPSSPQASQACRQDTVEQPLNMTLTLS